ncbi:hypothetical protein GCM10023094_00270 [Rhodococcus olei]|uniref:Winged helix-turn-helix domain-containing protein n=1 Tax=Rhodococcus olei TaxID=2161675 RepID=A0ABP8NTD9_9NOCA
MTVTESRAERELIRTAARHRVDDLELNRAIFRASHDGKLTQRRISAIVGKHSQATIQRILVRFSDDPSLLEETPAEVIDKRAAGLIDDDAMMDRLLNWRYTFGRVPYVDGVATDAYTSGDWDDIEQAYYLDRLTDDEFARLVERNKAHLERAARAQ